MCVFAFFCVRAVIVLEGEDQIVTLILQGVVLGILTGGVYALMASGLTLIFGVLEIINIAQGILVILGAYLSYWLEQRFHMDLFVGLLFTIPAMFLLGMAIEWAFIRRLKWERVRWRSWRLLRSPSSSRGRCGSSSRET